MGGRAWRALRRLRCGKAIAAGARFRRPASLLGRHDGHRRARRRSGTALRPCARRRIPGHQSAAGVHRAEAEAGRTRRHGGGRRRAGDLWLPRSDGAQHPRFSRPVHATREGDHARAQLSLDAANPRSVERCHRAGRATLHQGPRDRPHGRRTTSPGDGARRNVAGPVRRGARAEASRRRRVAEGSGGALPHVEPQRTGRTRARAPQDSVREIRRASFSRRVSHQGRVIAPALDRESAGTLVGVSNTEAAAGRRSGHRDALARGDGALARAARHDAQPEAARCGARRMDFAHRLVRSVAYRAQRLAGRARCCSRLVSTSTGTHLRRRGDARARPRAAEAHRRHLREPRALPDRAHARSARCEQWRSRCSAARRRVSDAVDHSLGKRAGMEIGADPELRRRLHPVGHGNGQDRRDRGRASPAVRCDDARERPSRVAAAAALLRAPAELAGDRHVYAARSRFLTDSVCANFEQESWPQAARENAHTVQAPATRYG